ncbi:cysteine-rich motor neuron 1 protein [Diorhabda carinulata]|uniref:cysteine-rich motor neuron 1 protein n=1 Tax=Diorhabda carinulata TaxID=1163345 RepID=UPI00259FE542|nr:cysteine-rich motor neuron 1 protein [Diorhabda carinulata]
MKSSKYLFIFFGTVFLQNCFAAPALSNPTFNDEDLTNSIEEENDEREEEDEDDTLVLDEDDFTTHGLERLSSAATCLVAGIEYTHGQQIYRQDQCEFCLCLDGEMFCWWQDCPPTMEGPCKDRGPFSPCMSVPANPQHSPSPSSSALSEITTRSNMVSSAKSTVKSWSSTKSSTTTSFKPLETSTYTERTSIDISSRPPESSTSVNNKYCVVMGQKYQIGDKLPHDTGNCLECICGQGAKVTCSPHQCAPVEDDLNDYHMSGARQSVPDIF